MSKTVHYKGKLKLIEKFPNETETIEEQCKRILEEDNIDISSCAFYFDNYEEILLLYDQLYNKYVIANGNLYKVLSKQEIEEYEMFNINDNKDGAYDYEVMYYNGGMGLDEAIEESFKNMEE